MARGKPTKPGAVDVVLHRLHPGQQKIVAHSARFKVVMCGRRFGKTALGIRCACDTAIAGKLVGWFSPTHKYALEVWRELLNRLAPIIANKSEQDKRIELVTGGVIEIWTFDTDDPARGRKYHRVIVDEAGLVPELERVWQSAIRLTLVDYQGDALFLGTPKGRQHGFVVLFAKGQSGNADWMSFRTSTLDNPYIPISEIEEARKDMPAAIFAQEIEGIPADDGGNPFGQTAIAECTKSKMPDADDPDHMPVVWGWDLARAQDWTVGIALDMAGNVVRVERWQLLPWSETVKKISQCTGDTPAWGDATGVGDPIIERLQEFGVPIEGFTFGSKSKQTLMERLASVIQHKEITFPMGVIAAELETFTYHYTATGVRYTAPSGLHDDAVMALGLAVYGYDRVRPMMQALPMRPRLTGDPNRVEDYYGENGGHVEGFDAQLPSQW
jgi:hypothetical protein